MGPRGLTHHFGIKMDPDKYENRFRKIIFLIIMKFVIHDFGMIQVIQ